MLYNRTSTYSLFHANRASPARASSAALSSTFDHPPCIRRFANRHFIHKCIDRKSDATPHKRTRVTREQCEHPWDEAAAAAVRTPVRRANDIFFSPRATRVGVTPVRGVGFRDASCRGIAPASDRRRTRETIDARIPDRRARFRRVSRRDVDVDRCKHFVWVYPPTIQARVD